MRLEDRTTLRASLGNLLILTEEVRGWNKVSVSMKSGAQTELDAKTAEANGGE
jgi:hypothetical protein